ncbi:MAG: ATP-binding protein, partial [Candidatus Parvarchaeum sp.]
ADLQNVLDLFLKMHPENVGQNLWLFLDEVQSINGWEKFVRSAVDKGIYVYVSGSSSKLLSKEIATEMRGRSVSYILFPLSFVEFLNFRGVKHERFHSTKAESMIAKSLEDYLEYGGYPEVAIAPELRDKILNEILEVTISRDVIERYHIRNPKIIKLLINSLANSFEFSTNKFYNFMKSIGYKIGKNTLYTYMQALNDAFVVYFLRNYSGSYKKKEQSIPKPYFFDNGLLKANGISDRSKLLENLVFTELLRKYGENSIFYAKGHSYDVDFLVAVNGKPKQLIQVSYEISNFSTQDRELRSLYNASKHIKCNNLMLITMNAEKTQAYKGKRIRIIPAWKWLLQIDYRGV